MPSIDHVWARQQEESDGFTREITRFALRKFGDRIYEAWQDFNMREVPLPLEEPADERQIFMPYFLFQWNPDGKSTTARGQGGVVARWYMLEKTVDGDGTDVPGAGHNPAFEFLRNGLE
jgi:hypothetical protein